MGYLREAVQESWNRATAGAAHAPACDALRRDAPLWESLNG